MIRLMLTLTPIVCVLASISISHIMDTFLKPTTEETSKEGLQQANSSTYSQAPLPSLSCLSHTILLFLLFVSPPYCRHSSFSLLVISTMHCSSLSPSLTASGTSSGKGSSVKEDKEGGTSKKGVKSEKRSKKKADKDQSQQQQQSQKESKVIYDKVCGALHHSVASSCVAVCRMPRSRQRTRARCSTSAPLWCWSS